MKKLSIILGLLVIFGGFAFANPTASLYTSDGIRSEVLEHEMAIVIHFTPQKLIIKVDILGGTWSVLNNGEYITVGYWLKEGAGSSIKMDLHGFDGTLKGTIYDKSLILAGDVFVFDGVYEGWYE